MPLIREGRALGSIAILRTEVGSFEQKHVALLSTFADQAAIAIENVRLFEAEQQRSQELNESLQQQTATADVLKIISRSTFDLKAVLNTLVEIGSTTLRSGSGNDPTGCRRDLRLRCDIRLQFGVPRGCSNGPAAAWARHRLRSRRARRQDGSRA